MREGSGNLNKCFTSNTLPFLSSGIEYRGHPLKIRRPNDYNPAMVPPSSESIKLDLSALGVVSTTVPDSPNKIFIGGIPYSLDEKQVMELLQAFGRLKAFHLVREAGSNQSKVGAHTQLKSLCFVSLAVTQGYAFAEYMDPSVTDKACSGLDGLPLLDRNLTVRRAQGAGSSEFPFLHTGPVRAFTPLPQMKTTWERWQLKEWQRPRLLQLVVLVFRWEWTNTEVSRPTLCWSVLLRHDPLAAPGATLRCFRFSSSIPPSPSSRRPPYAKQWHRCRQREAHSLT